MISTPNILIVPQNISDYQGEGKALFGVADDELSATGKRAHGMRTDRPLTNSSKHCEQPNYAI